MSRQEAFGPLGRRIILAFVAVTILGIALVAAAGLVGSVRGIDATMRLQRGAIAELLADRAAAGFDVGGWTDDGLVSITSAPEAEGLTVSVYDEIGELLAGQPMRGQGHGAVAQAPIVADDVVVGSLLVGGGGRAGGSGPGQSIAWTWILLAAAAAIVLATAAGWITARRLTRPVAALSRVARATAAGDRTARPSQSELRDPTEIGDLARVLDSALNGIAQSEAARHRLSADIAHELRTPLTVLQTALEEIRDGYVPVTDERLATLHAQVVRLGRIVADLADLAAAESAVFDLRTEQVDLRELVSDAAAAAGPSLSSAGLSMVVIASEPVVVDADPDRMHQAIGNLLSNAARYCRPGDSVVVSTWQEDRRAFVAVEDTGPGVPTADLPHVFERLWRGSGSASGSGIGLAVVREIVRAHGGEVSVRSSDGAGATFTIALPMR